MKRRKLIYCWAAFNIVFINAFLILLSAQTVKTAIVPPPWSDPEKNPCAALPGGWQLLYWPPLMKCFKIFTIGHPCPDTMELSPAAFNGRIKGSSRSPPAAECHCPPGTALSAKTNKCHTIFERGPCNLGEYFRPASPEYEKQLNKKMEQNHRYGICQMARRCPDSMIYWPVDGKCYTQFTKGPCVKGKLLVLNSDGLAECKCHDGDELRAYYYDEEETCHEHYTKGPCSTPGHLFLPGGRCGCNKNLPHYHEEQEMCFELNSPGPCPPGHVFNIPESITRQETTSYLLSRARCQCKEGYVPWSDGSCYRLYTRGPCGPNEFLINATSCVKNMCGKNRLYFPDQKSCYRIGSQGPCSLNQVVVFDFNARPSVDGISYNGLCGCSGVIMNLNQQCTSAEEDAKVNTCEATPGMAEINGICYKLYSRGPCGPGQWLAPSKVTPVGVAMPQMAAYKAKCVCRPGFTVNNSDDITEQDELTNPSGMVRSCNAPSVGLARYLNNQRQNHKFYSSTATTTNYSFNFFNFHF